mmetsp:Transcript_47374/g.78505  ORF Transcript_47374/g.78505 Transcript_47374/m.78505 type:complete len:435 (+) Transcript_47374:27-1331(+)
MFPQASASWLLLGFALPIVLSIDNGKGITPPMGWRSWNLYGENIDQETMMKIMDGMVSRKRQVDGKNTSLCDIGYCDVGLDDNWQICAKSPEHGYTYHSDAGFPAVNPGRFPDMIAMTTYAHKLNLTAGWYFNNCICKDHCGNGKDQGETDESCYVGDADALVQLGFDSVKLDGCGNQRDLNVWARLFKEAGKSIMIENCHWGGTVPNATWCPFNFYRTSGDVVASYASVLNNLASTYQWASKNLSTPGCWAYPDMLEVGCQHGPHGDKDPGLSEEETRTHFGAWCIVSSPLTLSHDVNNDTIMDQVWEVITNPEAIAINQAYAGFSGGPFQTSDDFVVFPSVHEEDETFKVPGWTYLYKPLNQDNTKIAVLMMNSNPATKTLKLDFSTIPGFKCEKGCQVRDVWARQDLGGFDDSFSVAIKSHDSAFLVVSSS